MYADKIWNNYTIYESDITLSSKQTEELSKFLFFMFWSVNSNSRYIKAKGVLLTPLEDIVEMIKYDGNIIDQYILDKVKLGNTTIEIRYTQQQEKSIRTYIDMIKRVVTEIGRKASLKGILKGTEIILDTTSYRRRTEGEVMFSVLGTYSVSKGTIVMFKDSLQKADIFLSALLHEMGHSYYYEVMNDDQRKRWEEYFDEAVDSSLDVIPTKYAHNDASEFFAEVFSVYTLRWFNIEVKDFLYMIDKRVFEVFRGISRIREVKEAEEVLVFLESKESFKDWINLKL